MGRPAKSWWFWMATVAGKYRSFGTIYLTEAEAFAQEQQLRLSYPAQWFRWRYGPAGWAPDTRSAPQFLASAYGGSSNAV